MNCDYCGTKLFESDRECPRCGGNIAENEVKVHNGVSNVAQKEWYDEAIAIAVAGGDLSIRLGQIKQLEVYGLTAAASPFLLSNDWLNFIPEKNNMLYVSPSDGNIYGNRRGKTKLKISCKERPVLEAVITVEIT